MTALAVVTRASWARESFGDLCVKLQPTSSVLPRRPDNAPPHIRRKSGASRYHIIGIQRGETRSTLAQQALPGLHILSGLSSNIPNLQLGAEAVGAWIQTLHPAYYILYFWGAGVGLPFSEDAMVAWVGSQITAGQYGSWQMSAAALASVAIGVVSSDLVTFWIGRLVKLGMFPWLRERLVNSPSYDRATKRIQKAGGKIGFIQRFSIGFRGPLCILAGFTGVPFTPFLLGTCLGAMCTIPIQVLLGYFLRNSSNVYLATLALVAAPALAGPIIGSVAAGLGFFVASKPNTQQDDAASQTKVA